jgi:hypothetical protein
MLSDPGSFSPCPDRLNANRFKWNTRLRGRGWQKRVSFRVVHSFVFAELGTCLSSPFLTTPIIAVSLSDEEDPEEDDDEVEDESVDDVESLPVEDVDDEDDDALESSSLPLLEAAWLFESDTAE